MLNLSLARKSALENIRKSQGGYKANFTKLALHDMPSHPGKKRNERIRKRTPKKSLPTDDPFSGDFKL